jgi:hypothetical protein
MRATDRDFAMPFFSFVFEERVGRERTKVKQSFGAGDDKVGGRASVRASDKEGMWFDLFLK